ncbi:PREDICTED: nuclear nucleic acid-binding protein C1D-like isoform X1 [Amphimedon queenslandica]|uniref:Nuclear nucleic acid-binding protein C1D n=1 Tax=Amphimedon queenslandica TaxID=400682 RepID=A0AAN0JCF1_AMPQE|nr:PREDICTED: nuclear nucleic acid-binding protein C1D-like isoform X1 [Amphimedon queenslandica]|eukprot:XP_019854421.1 PREDICTED: nuclear nucleic acid-binding protein C1D-like isoform X1 [Amphimedon queenslandica]
MASCPPTKKARKAGKEGEEGPKVEEEDEDEVPEEIEDQCSDCHQSLAKLEKLLKPVLAEARPSHDKLSHLENASLTLTLCYTINSLFWVYLTTQGINPKTHGIKHELERVQKYMNQANIINERLKGEVPRVDEGAAKRFVKNALWDEESSSSKSRKRKQTEDKNQ